ncbi:Fizzy-related protein, partial [Cryptotermes secundus]
GNLLALGTDDGGVQVWETASKKPIKMMESQSGRVRALAWNGDVTSGSYDGLIMEGDVRMPSLVLERSAFHEREVCGLKWSPCKQYLASGGNDNRFLVWDLHSLSPVWDYTEHSAGVKAIAWSPHHCGLLATGGGAADWCIHIWDLLTGQGVKHVDTGSQVSTHGDFQNQLHLWKYPGMMQLASLTAHLDRVLYMALSPDGEAVATTAADETLHFWNVFRKPHSQKASAQFIHWEKVFFKMTYILKHKFIRNIYTDFEFVSGKQLTCFCNFIL